MSPHRPSGEAMRLAALCHSGIYLVLPGTVYFHLVMGLFGPRDWDGQASSFTGIALLILFVGAVFGPGAAALWAARGSPWRPFLFIHAATGMVAHATVLLGVAALEPLPSTDSTRIPGVVDYTRSILILPWFILTMGATFRALGGDAPWYPLLTRAARRFAPGPAVAP